MNYLSRIKISIANKFPTLPRLSRFIKASYFSGSKPKKSYSQHGEDIFIWDILNNDFPNTKYTYIDIGAFHPVLLSNTYLMYRRKMNGVVVEPNKELVNLHKIFRPRDVQLEIACSNSNKISKFYFQKTFPALSSLNIEESNKINKCEYVPVFNLDTISQSLAFSKTHFLSIDVEGIDFEVLEGAEKTLLNTFIICIECSNERTEETIRCFLKERNFILLRKFQCNLIFKNENFIAG